MKKFLKGLIAAAFVAGTAVVSHAQNFQSINLAVTVNSSIDISIVGTSTITFAAVNLGNATGVAGGNSVNVRNDSVGLNVSYMLAGNNDSNWAWAPTAGANAFAVRAKFNSTAVAVGAFSDANDTVTVAAGTFPGGFTLADGTKFAGDQTGVSVAPTVVQNVWAKFIPATTSSVLWGSRSLVMSIVAQLP